MVVLDAKQPDDFRYPVVFWWGLCSHFVLRIPIPLAAGHFNKMEQIAPQSFLCPSATLQASLPVSFGHKKTSQ